VRIAVIAEVAASLATERPFFFFSSTPQPPPQECRKICGSMLSPDNSPRLTFRGKLVKSAGWLRRGDPMWVPWSFAAAEPLAHAAFHPGGAIPRGTRAGARQSAPPRLRRRSHPQSRDRSDGICLRTLPAGSAAPVRLPCRPASLPEKLSADRLAARLRAGRHSFLHDVAPRLDRCHAGRHAAAAHSGWVRTAPFPAPHLT